ncbi:MAG: hypothetical protein QG622_3716 [Actinomycetota bacterium]|nr:hypothetical protein [Actinomycetota bacterium]
MPVELDHPLVMDFVTRLQEAASALPVGPRDELITDIRTHLSEGLADIPDDDPAAVRELLDRLGDPADIVAEELRETGTAASGATRWGLHEIAAVALLTVGSLLILIGPAAGLILTWTSTRLTRQQKRGITAGGLALAIVLTFFLLFFSVSVGPASLVPATPVPVPPLTVTPS